MDKIIEQAIKNCKINKYEKYFEEVCKEYKRLLDAENQQLNLQNVIERFCALEDAMKLTLTKNIGKVSLINRLEELGKALGRETSL
jgi:hypothetical protein